MSSPYLNLQPRTLEQAMTDKLDALIARLEAATEGSETLNEIIAVDLGYVYLPGDGFTMYQASWMKDNEKVALPDWTRSLDAALSLVPEGWIWDVTSTGAAWVMTDQSAAERLGEDLHLMASGATPALALCIAALKARRG